MHLLALVDELLGLETVTQGLAKDHILADEIRLFLDLAQFEKKVVEIDWFCQVLRRPGLQGPDSILDAPEGGDHDHLRRRVDLLYPFEEGQAVRVRQPVVEKDDLEDVLLKEGKGAFPVRCLTHRVAFFPEQPAEERPLCLFVFHDQYADPVHNRNPSFPFTPSLRRRASGAGR
ncbi:MAG: hypothetical protein A4E61_00105 [Syntrophorhabdus sp. PtaB.Bin184]|nr:MAG: hypothetical protein A4E61_00105 [Syntrophorhabdus sp. PtaB.Bin184]